jgi:predicted kinase
MNKLILTVGLPRSGKSTWSRGSGYPVVNPDSIRLALHGHAYIGSAEPMIWAVAKLMTASLFKAGHDTVVLDATNTTVARRAEWLKPDEWEVEYRSFKTPTEVTIERAHLTGKPELIPVIERMAAEMQWPEDHELCHQK